MLLLLEETTDPIWNIITFSSVRIRCLRQILACENLKICTKAMKQQSIEKVLSIAKICIQCTIDKVLVAVEGIGVFMPQIGENDMYHVVAGKGRRTMSCCSIVHS